MVGSTLSDTNRLLEWREPLKRVAIGDHDQPAMQLQRRKHVNGWRGWRHTNPPH